MHTVIDNRQSIISYNKELEDLINEVIRKSLELENINKEVEISISFVNNEEIKLLNKTYRGIDKVTDVLSFPQFDNFKGIETDEEYVILGDIVISLEKAEEQAIEYGHSFIREVAFLVAHSMFHLFGYAHDTEENQKIMREKEERVLTALGILR